MSLINDATKITLGDIPVQAVYAGDTKVWSSVPELPTIVIDSMTASSITYLASNADGSPVANASINIYYIYFGDPAEWFYRRGDTDSAGRYTLTPGDLTTAVFQARMMLDTVKSPWQALIGSTTVYWATEEIAYAWTDISSANAAVVVYNNTGNRTYLFGVDPAMASEHKSNANWPENNTRLLVDFTLPPEAGTWTWTGRQEMLKGYNKALPGSPTYLHRFQYAPTSGAPMPPTTVIGTYQDGVYTPTGGIDMTLTTGKTVNTQDWPKYLGVTLTYAYVALYFQYTGVAWTPPSILLAQYSPLRSDQNRKIENDSTPEERSQALKRQQEAEDVKAA